MSERLSIRRVDCRTEQAAATVAEIRKQLSPRGDVVSPRGRALTEKVFGKPLTPRQVVEHICDDVARNGLSALLRYSRDLDRAELTAETIRVPVDELRNAHRKADSQYLATLHRVARTILDYQSAVLNQDVLVNHNTFRLQYTYRPVRRVGICVPGGAAAYPSTLLMCAIPAQAAGVKEIAVVAPPTAFGSYNQHLLAACYELGIQEVYRIGGAQAVAALAYGVEAIAPVDKIVGPGNLFVALAKQRVSESVGIDMMAGPTEVVLLADDSANPHYLAADLISQAEHSPGASILISWGKPELLDRVHRSLEVQLARLERSDLIRDSLQEYGALIQAASEEQGCRLSDDIAPEHLQIETEFPQVTLQCLGHHRIAGAIFMGHHTPVAVGDYVAGPSHTLPTGGSARFASGLSANDFLRRVSIIDYTPAKLAEVADDLQRLAAVEGLTGHGHSVAIRVNPDVLKSVEDSCP